MDRVYFSTARWCSSMLLFWYVGFVAKMRWYSAAFSRAMRCRSFFREGLLNVRCCRSFQSQQTP